MRVNIDEIKEHGLERSWDLSREQVDAFVSGDRAGHRARGPAHVDARLERFDRRVRVDGRAQVPLTVPCRRCLSPVSLDLPVEFDLTLVPAEAQHEGGAATKDPGTGPVGGTFGTEEAEEETYTGKVIDLDPLVREELLLALPSYPLCDESCKGLCPVCGANLNERECGCDRHVPDPRWAGLKNVKLD